MIQAIFNFGIIDFVIILSFFVIILFVGIKHGLEITDLRGYAVGNNNFKTAAIVATLTATYMSGSAFFTDIHKTYTESLLFVVCACMMGVKPLIMAQFFIPKMKGFIGKLTIAEKMGEIYDDRIRMIIAFTSSIGTIGMIAVQFKVFASILSIFTEIPLTMAVIISGITVTLYSSLGGIKSVTTTDKIQLAAFLIAIPYVILIIIDTTFAKGFSAEGAPPLINIPAGNLTPKNPNFWDLVFMGMWFIFPSMQPATCQRILMAKNVAQAKKAFIYSSWLIIFITILICIIGLMVYNFDQTLGKNDIIKYIVNNFTSVGLKGFLIVGVVAMAMSTADSYINISSVLFSNDICKPLKIGIGKELLISKVFAIALGIGAIFLALTDKDLLTIVLLTAKFYKPLITAPIMLTILGFRTTTKSILIGMGAGLFVVLVSGFEGNQSLYSLIATVTNAVFLLGSHYVLKQQGGWTKVELDDEEDHRTPEQIIMEEKNARMNKLKWQIAGDDQELYQELEKTLNMPQEKMESETHKGRPVKEMIERLKQRGMSKTIISQITGLPEAEI